RQPVPTVPAAEQPAEQGLLAVDALAADREDRRRLGREIAGEIDTDGHAACFGEGSAQPRQLSLECHKRWRRGQRCDVAAKRTKARAEAIRWSERARERTARLDELLQGC